MIRRTALALALLVALPAAGQIYGWKDREGRTYYSDQPPPAGATRILQTPRQPPAEPLVEPTAAPDAGQEGPDRASHPRTLAERELEFRQRRAAAAEAQAKADEEAAHAAERERFCQEARNQLGALASGQRITRFNAAGEREYLDDVARVQEAGRLQRQFDELCR